MSYYAVDSTSGKLVGGCEVPNRAAAAHSNGPGPAGRHYGPEDTYIIEVCERSSAMGGGWHITLPAPHVGSAAPTVVFNDRWPHMEPLTEWQAATAGAQAIHALLQLDKGYGS